MLQFVNQPARALSPPSGPSLLPWCIFSMFYVASVATLFLRPSQNRAGNKPFFYILTPFAVGISMHVVYVVYNFKWNRTFPPNASMGRLQRIHSIFRICTDFRGVSGNSAAAVDPTNTRWDRDRLAFGVFRLFRLLSLMELHRMANRTVSHIHGRLGISIRDFAYDRQGLLPLIRRRELCLRALISYYWIWGTSAVLTSAHDLFAILFVVVLEWDRPDEWPSLYGNVADAYSLCRFWGVFWHRCHVKVFDAYMPPSRILLPLTRLWPHRLDRQLQKTRWLQPWIENALRALWIFSLSAACHAVVNLISIGETNARAEFRFFLSNWSVCLAETACRAIVRRMHSLPGYTDRNLTVRILGYTWVVVVFFCLVPSWQYSLILVRVTR